MEIKANKKFTENELLEYNPLVFAFIGDAIHTLYVRNYFVSKKNLLVKDEHNLSKNFCSAKAQSKVLLCMQDLSEEEKNLVRRTRNTKTSHKAKNVTLEEYKNATGLEVLIGYNYLLERNKRVEEILKFCMLIGEQDAN